MLARVALAAIRGASAPTRSAARCFAARPDAPPSVLEAADLGAAGQQPPPPRMQQPGKDRPMAPPEELKGEAEKIMSGTDNVYADGARVLGSAGTLESHSPPRPTPGARPPPSLAAMTPPPGPGTETPPPPPAPASAAPRGARTASLPTWAMNSTDAGADGELMRGRLRELQQQAQGQAQGQEGAEGQGEEGGADKARPGVSPMSL
ncbi:hypothetical protein HYH03_005924 [Edaphochlamys debaryana]|uniref:Uncharacterized protein n=1 Tax=Edaphochlamys debaryana TaxID=47281 RepID=A0A836C1L4_9CHLO|nr:hypothetical protein HYH03_005924 [Edaphochlamys debaryana]|eukprot:KAG2496002.1 hypothetical protein HYH03_005924 [Edaphochlamys debaryana]